MKTSQKWLKMSKVVIAWKIWRMVQIEVKVHNSNKALSSILILSLKKFKRGDAPKWNVCFTPNSCQEKVNVDDYSKRRTWNATLNNY